MTPINYLKSLITGIPKLSRLTGYSSARLTLAFLRCFIVRHTQFEEFRTLRLYEASNLHLSRILTCYECMKISDKLNEKATKEDTALFDDKHLLYDYFRGYIHRDWLSLENCTEEDIAAFLLRNEYFLIKPCVSSRGKGISKFCSKDLVPEDFIREYLGKDFVAEAFIRQHSALSAINPTSVNTVRIVTAARHGRMTMIGGGLRCGGSTDFVDNFHHGGAAYPIDMDSGIITEPGITLDGLNIICHPSTQHIMPGFQIPHWEKLTETIRSAALHNPRVGYVGWDFAITEDGVELIEGNINYPGNNVIQLGSYPTARQRLLDFMKD